LYNSLKSREIAFAMATTEALNPSQFSLLTNLTADRSSSPNPQQEMDKVIILVNAEAQASGQMSRLSPVTEKMVIALKNAVPKSLAVEVTGAASLWSKMESGKTSQNNLIWCPLTIQLPNWVNFPGKKVYQACRDIEERRAWVAHTLHYKTSQGDSSFGDLWLPITVTSKGLEYGEVIGEGMIPNAYSQPISLERESLKSLHRLASQLLDNLQAPASVYLLQFRLAHREVVFDRLWPFPAAPAIASLRGQQTDLYAAYWNCLRRQAMLDHSLAI
jgi:hypothetical protein